MLVGKSTAPFKYFLLGSLHRGSVFNAFESFLCRLAASWALYESQEKMAAVAKKHGIELTFFHGKGGTVGRGGNPALYRAILSHPPNTINGRFRVTEQGEMITQNFGSPAIAERTLDIYTAAVCREAFTKHVEPTKKWRQEMDRISEVSCDDYRQLVREEPRFVPYFRQATPELELGSLNIGSRPAKRNPKGGVESLRAIPWQFAWAQTRTMLPAWSGVGAGLAAKVCRSRTDFLTDSFPLSH
jgi:phosphoenolpyruvate carboxylase